MTAEAPRRSRAPRREPRTPVRDIEPIIARIRERLALDGGDIDVVRIAEAAREQGLVLGAGDLLALTTSVRDHVHGLGPLEGLDADGITDIVVNPDGSVWIDDADGLHRTGRHLEAAEARALAVRLATSAGRRLDDAVPYADAQLPDGSRLHAILPPLTGPGTAISLRRPADRSMSLDALCSRSGLTPAAVAMLRAIVRAKCAFVVSGGTGTGKTTLLGALLAEVERSERIVVVEDARELAIPHPHVVHLQSRHPNIEGTGGIDMRSLVRQCLRMRPDRIVVGECRGEEVRELLQALNTGHEGGCGTLHANTAADVPARLEALGALGGLGSQALATQAASALDLVIHVERTGSVRRPAHIALLGRGEDGMLTTVPAVDLARIGTPKAGRALGPGWPELRRRLGEHAPADVGALP